MNKKNLLLTIAAILFTASSCIEAQNKETRTIGEFTKIDVSGGVDLYLTQGDKTELIVEYNNDGKHKVITEVKGNTLHIYDKSDSFWNFNNATKVYLTTKDFTEIAANGGSDVYGQNLFVVDHLILSTSGGADASIEVQCENIQLKSSGGSDIKIKGIADQIDASASGGSDIDAGQLRAQTVKAHSSGGADIKVWAEQSLSASASGGSDVYYHGNPQTKDIEESGAGDVKSY